MAKKKTNVEPFLMLKRKYYKTPQVQGLSHSAFRLLWVLIDAHNGLNNGSLNLSKTWVKATLQCGDHQATTAVAELVNSGLVVITRYPRNKVARLCALRWLPPGTEKPLRELEVSDWPIFSPENAANYTPELVGSPVPKRRD